MLHQQRHLYRTTRKRAPGGTFDKRVYVDAIRVPRGVPDEFKARNQVAAGFESFLVWRSTTNKHVDWITSLMAWQNRMALDMLL